MVYNIKKSDGTPLVSIPDSTQDTTTTSLILPGRNAVNFGLSIDQNFVDLMQNFANSSPPPNPLQGQVWFDTVANELKVYNGTRWISITTGSDGSSGVATIEVGPSNSKLTIVISQYQIIVVFGSERIQRSDCPDTVIYNDISYAFGPRFPNGIYPGINLSVDPTGVTSFWMNGNSTYANVLVNARTVFINGSVYGQYQFDGSSNVNVAVHDSNVYVGNTNVTVSGTWTKVLVSDGGRILAGNNIVASDVVAALGYTPYNGANINVNAYSNTIVARDQNANFAANVVVASSVAATGTVSANRLSWTVPQIVYLNGDIYGNVQLTGGNAILQSSLVTSGVTPGVYNLVNVDAKGRVTNAGYYDQSPFNSISIFPSDGYIPIGWAECNGGTVTDPYTGTVTITPNLTSASGNISVGAGITLKYYIKYISAAPKADNISLPAGTPGSGPSITLNNPTSTSVSDNLSGGPVSVAINGSYGNLTSTSNVVSTTNTSPTFTNTNFADTTFFDAIALVMGLGDTNGIMFSTYDVWNNQASLTVQNILDNLHLRASQNLPAQCGKYMIPVSLLLQQTNNLNIPNNFAYTPLLQDQLMSSITNNFAHQLLIAGMPAVDNNLFGCYYLGSAAAWIAVAKSSVGSNVRTVLHNNGFYTTQTSNLDSYDRETFMSIIAEIVTQSKVEIQNRRQLNQNVITSGQGVTVSNVNVIATGSTVNGYHIGNNVFVDKQGGYFEEYDILNSTISTDTAVVGPSTTFGSVGTVSLAFVDASACALTGLLQSDNYYDQAAIAQVAVNRLGATISGAETYPGKTGFDLCTTQDSFTGISASIYGPNDDATATAKYGNCYVNMTYLKDALTIENSNDFKNSLGSLFGGVLTDAQLTRVDILRRQVYNNGSEMAQAQAAIKGTLTIVPPSFPASEVVIKPFGDNAYGYLISSSAISGFYVPNSCDLTASAPAPSPQALLDRLLRNLEKSPILPTDTYKVIVVSESNAAQGGNTVVSTPAPAPIPESGISSQPDQSSGANYTPQSAESSGNSTSGSNPWDQNTSTGWWFWKH